MRALLKAQLKSEIKDKTILVRSIPFVGLMLLLFAFAFDPDRGILSQVSPGLWWVSVTFAAMFIFIKDAHHRKETDFINQFGIEAHKLFINRVIINFILTFIITLISAFAILMLFSPEIKGIFLLIAISVFGTLAIAIIGAIYAPLVSKLYDSGQLLAIVTIPILIPALLAAIQATNATLGQYSQNGWNWFGLLALFCVVFLCFGLLASDSIEE